MIEEEVPFGPIDLSKYLPEYAELAFNYCLLGATNAQLAEFFDVCVGTIQNWQARHAEFARALREGKAVADAKVAAALYNRAVGYTYVQERISADGKVTQVNVEVPGEVEAQKYWLKNRQPLLWRDRTEYTGADGGPMLLGGPTDLEVARRIAFVLARATQSGVTTILESKESPVLEPKESPELKESGNDEPSST